VLRMLELAYQDHGRLPWRDLFQPGIDIATNGFNISPRMAASIPACRAVVAARLHAPEREQSLLRRLRVRTFSGELLDVPETIAAAAVDAGIDPVELALWTESTEVADALAQDMDLARHPRPAGLALDRKLAGWSGGRRYTCPTYEFSVAGAEPVIVPGFQPFAAYDVALANLSPGLERREAPESVTQVLEWAECPLATAEVAALAGLDLDEARSELARVAEEQPAGADGYWTLP